MDEQLLQRTRYQLQTRFRRVRKAKLGHYELICQQLMSWLENHPLISSIIQHLDTVEGEHHHEIELITQIDKRNYSIYYYVTVKKEQNENFQDFVGYTPITFEQHASACLQILRASIEIPEGEFYCVLGVYLTQEEYSVRLRYNETLNVLQEIAVRDLYEYIDEHLDGINAVNGLMQKYKQGAEWFEAGKLREIVNNSNSRQTERSLAVHLQHYIFNQGVEFMIEPSSASGEADLVLRDASSKYIIIDAKYVKENSARSVILKKIADGFNQVSRYCNDYNQPEGFLAVYVNDDISINIELQSANGFDFVKVGGKTIYYIEVNIADRPTASKSGKMKQIVISAEELFQEIEELTS